MSNRDRMVELCSEKIRTMKFLNSDHWFDFTEKMERVVDHLLANGVIVPPCKVGDTVCTIHKGNYAHNWKPYVDELCVVEINHKCDRNGKDIGWGLVLYSSENCTTTRYRMSNVGKNVFLTKEEAEAKLKELKKSES